jgi:hypothetical protein
MMDSDIKTKAAQAAQDPATKDLSEAVTASVQRDAGEVVRTVRVFGDNYRCNWWVSDPAAGPVYLDVGRIVKSKLLRATMIGDKLIVEDVQDVSSRRRRELLSGN